MIVRNPASHAAWRPPRPNRDPLQFHSRLKGYAPTPLHVLPRLAEQLGVARVFVKDESSRLGLPAFKILGASWAAYRSLAEKLNIAFDDWQSVEDLARLMALHDLVTLFSATDGNHGRAVARVARMFGLKARIYVPNGTATARIAAIESESAHVTIVDGTYDDTVTQASHDANESGGVLIQDNSWEGYERIPQFVIEGYSTLLWETDDELSVTNEPEPTHVFVQVGNGSFADAVLRHFRSRHSRAVIVGVEPESAACVMKSVLEARRVRLRGPFDSIMVGMNCDSPSLISFPVLQQGMDAFVSLADSRAVEAVKLFHQNGVVSGETGAAGLGALLDVINDVEARGLLGISDTSRVLVFSTEGATNPELYESIICTKNYFRALTVT